MAGAKNYTYCLPDKNSMPQLHACAVNSLVILGANASGKSQLAAWMKEQDPKRVRRVAVRKDVGFLDGFLPPSGDADTGAHAGTDAGSAGATGSASRAKHRKKKKSQQRQWEPSLAARLLLVWAEVFPGRRIDASSSKPVAVYEQGKDHWEYAVKAMSSGERAALSLIAQVLRVGHGKTILVDEPEAHLHPSVVGRLWRALEQARPDCFFVFITHDVQFAVTHGSSDRIWIKSYDGKRWNWEYVPESDLPERMLLELLGNQKNVLFIEGGKNSYDVRMYTALYPGYYVVPCGGCSQVISNTKAFAATRGLSDMKAFGLIDRDYRSDEELEALAQKGVFSLKVAEVENLFLVEPLLHAFARQLGCMDVDAIVAEIKDYVIASRFNGQLGRQICQATISSLKAQLSAIAIDGENSPEVSDEFRQAIAGVSPEGELQKQGKRFRGALDARNYEDVLKLFNAKDVAKSVGHFFGIEDKTYCTRVIALLSSDAREQITQALSPYVPNLPDPH